MRTIKALAIELHLPPGSNDSTDACGEGGVAGNVEPLRGDRIGRRGSHFFIGISAI